MQNKIQYLYYLLLFCNGANTITPIIPDIIGLPPTAPTAKGKS